MKKFENIVNVIARSGDNRDVAMTCSTLALAFVLSLGITSESLAECNSGDFSCNGSTGASAYCCYHVVSTDADGKKNIEIYKDPDAPEGAQAKVGNMAFYGSNGGKFASVDIKEGITEVGAYAFCYHNGIKSLSMPFVSVIGQAAFTDVSTLESLDMPNVTSTNTASFMGVDKLTYLGMKTEISVPEGATGAYPKTRRGISCTITDGYKICGTCDDYVKSGTGCVENCGRGYLGKNGKCIDSALGCGTNYKDMGGFCNRVRYTPAEAAEIAKDDGNVVTITFRK